jgi:quercetin dioxygenase-like cupin family protein
MPEAASRGQIDRIDTSRQCIVIGRDLKMVARPVPKGPPVRADGFTVGVVEMSRAPPHGGEVHPDGDELIIILSGRARLLADSMPDAPLELGPGDACIIPKGEWHRFQLIEPTRLMHITPGPNGDHRPPAKDLTP